MDLQSYVTRPSTALPGVEFDIRRMTFARRLDLMTQIRELSQQREFHAAGAQPEDRMESALLSMRIDRIYLAWGFQAARGLTLDGVPVTADALWQQAPEAFTREVIDAIRAEAGLREDERKN